MKKVVLFFVLCVFFAAPAMADYYGGRMNWTRVDNHYAGNGGEFTLYKDGIPQYLSNYGYADVARNQIGATDTTSFQTFCVEMSETVKQPMDLWVSTTDMHGNEGWSHAIKGGGSYDDDDNPPPTTFGDDLESETAYLYREFARGTLSNYVWSGAGRAASAGTLQKTIWFLEGEIGNFADSSGGFVLDSSQQAQANAWIAEAENAISTGQWSGLGVGSEYVYVLNTYGTDGSKLAQDQLYYVPVPGAILLGLLGLGAAGVKLRKFA